MGYTFGEKAVGDPLTAGRQEWLRWVLERYGVSADGASQFVGAQPVTDANDRRQLLEVINRVVVQGSGDPRNFRGIGRGSC